MNKKSMLSIHICQEKIWNRININHHCNKKYKMRTSMLRQWFACKIQTKNSARGLITSFQNSPWMISNYYHNLSFCPGFTGKWSFRSFWYFWSLWYFWSFWHFESLWYFESFWYFDLKASFLFRFPIDPKK